MKESTSNPRIAQLKLDLGAEKPSLVSFDGEDITGNTGILLAAQVERLTGLLRGASSRLNDHRTQSLIMHSQFEEVAQRVPDSCGVRGWQRQQLPAQRPGGQDGCWTKSVDGRGIARNRHNRDSRTSAPTKSCTSSPSGWWTTTYNVIQRRRRSSTWTLTVARSRRSVCS
ncbi:MAG: transposase [Candidatus Melainabacteria bacterium]|nr:transposase [Candidatus Melainabacteria bacterium]